MKYLDEELVRYAKTDMYPFHMPGHKRRSINESNPYAIDITEIDGFDNLHHAEEILKEAQQRAAALYGAQQSFYLINGSTCGILAAISSTIKKGGKLLLARNSHKAAYHAVYLRELEPVYLYPVITSSQLQGCICPQEVERRLKENPDVQAVFITSPTYEGITSDLVKIAEIVHSYRIPLIVDEAHGAHFGFHPYFPETAVRLGADLIIQSMHKTLPSFTQTALLHVASQRVNVEELQRFLRIYETSSPSYVFMAGMDRCVRLLEEQGAEQFGAYADRLKGFYERCQRLQHVQLVDLRGLPASESYQADPSKLVLRGTAVGLDGRQLYDLLREKYHLQLEMCSGDYALAMTSFMDEDEAYDRLYAALAEIDAQCSETFSTDAVPEKHSTGFIPELYQDNPMRMLPAQAIDEEHSWCPITEAVGEVSGDYVFLYPPGIPFLVPGEEITPHVVESIRACMSHRLNLMGMESMRIKIVNSPRIHYTRGKRLGF